VSDREEVRSYPQLYPRWPWKMVLAKSLILLYLGASKETTVENENPTLIY
jgi:hypothetical protein